MREVTKTYKVYKYEELSDKAKERALENHNDNDDLSFILPETLKNDLNYFLEENKIEELNNKHVHYSLNYCQGDGCCFVGTYRWKDYNIKIIYYGYYSYHRSVYFEFENTAEIPDGWTEADQDAKMDEDETEFKYIYKDICLKLEKSGYNEIEYQQSETNFKELCDGNNWEFLENGERWNND